MIVWLGLIALVFVAIVYLFVSIGGILWPGGPQLPPDAARNLSLALLLVMLLLCGVVFGGLFNVITTSVAQAEPTRIALVAQNAAATATLASISATSTPTVQTILPSSTSTGNAATTQTADAARVTRDTQATLDAAAQQTAIAATLNAAATHRASTQTVAADETSSAAAATTNAQATLNAGVRQTAIIVTLNALATDNAATQTIAARDASGANARATVNAQATINSRMIQTAVAATSAVLSTINAATQTAIANEVARTQTPLALTATALATRSASSATATTRPTPSPTRASTPTLTITALPLDPTVLIDTVLRGVIERANQAEIDALLSDDDSQLEPWWEAQALARVKVNVQNVRARFVNVTDVQWEPIGDGIQLITSNVTTATYVTSERWTFVGTINQTCPNGSLAQRRYVEAYPAEQYRLELHDNIISVAQWDIGRAVVQEISPPLCP